MSPEQARGNPEEIDLRTDVYALGVVLYQMVAGRMPYEVGRTSIVEAVRVICEERPAPLREAWRGRGRLDPDLETIVGKALAKEADGRYASASALGDDVARLRTGQPIQARPPSTIYQLRKAVARNRLPFALAAAAVLVLIGLAAGMSLLYARAERNRVRAVAAEERAQKNFGMARDAVDKYLTSVSESPELKSAGLEPLRRSLLETARQFYGTFATQQQGSAALQHELGWANLRLGDIDRATGDSARAEQAYLEGIRLAKALAAEHPDDPSFVRQELTLQANLGTLYTDLGRHDDAERALRRGMEAAGALLARDPGSSEDRFSQAMLADRLGILLERMQRVPDAEASYREGLALREALVAAGPSPANRYALVESATNLGALLARGGRPQEAEPVLERAVVLADQLTRETPGNEVYVNGRAAAYGNLAGVYMLTGRLDRAGEAYRQELASREQLARIHPTILEYRLVHAGTLTNLGELETRAGRPAAALPWYAGAIEQLEALLAVEPRHANGRFYLSYTFSWQARAFEALGRRADALAAWERAIAFDDRKDPGLVAERDRLRAGRAG
jgi:tetratricopeptide (TPR) repeat protein